MGLNAAEPGRAFQDLKYDAYIACHPAVPDLTIARKLAEEIHHYKLPNGVLSQESALYFNDIVVQDASAASSDALSDNVRYILENSRCLIIICSSDTRNSVYVHRLIEYFIALGRKSNIIPILAEGEPLTSFPPQFFEKKTYRKLINDNQIEEWQEITEPLAADIRSETLKKSLKLLKHAKLKVIAELIGCTYDDLERRHYKRAQQRLLSLAAIFGSIIICVTGMFSYLALKALNQAEISRKQTLMANDVLKRIYVEMPKTFSGLPEAWPLVEDLMLENAENLIKSNKQKASIIDLSSLLSSSSSDNFEAAARKAVILRQLGKGSQGLEILISAAGSAGEIYETAARWLYERPNDYGAALFVNDVIESGAALEAGIQAGDIIFSIDNKSFTTTLEFTRYIAETDNNEISVALFHRNQNGLYSQINLRVKLKNGHIGINYLPL